LESLYSDLNPPCGSAMATSANGRPTHGVQAPGIFQLVFTPVLHDLGCQRLLGIGQEVFQLSFDGGCVEECPIEIESEVFVSWCGHG
jgi:hypothetical protein